MPFLILGGFSLIGVYFNYIYIYSGDLEKYERKILLENKNEGIEINNNNVDNNKSLLTAIRYVPTIYLNLCQIIQLNTLDFFIPTLVNHLKDKFDISTSKASWFFIMATLGSAICTRLITKFTDCFNNFQLMYYGLFIGALYFNINRNIRRRFFIRDNKHTMFFRVI